MCKEALCTGDGSILHSYLLRRGITLWRKWHRGLFRNVLVRDLQSLLKCPAPPDSGPDHALHVGGTSAPWFHLPPGYDVRSQVAWDIQGFLYLSCIICSSCLPKLLMELLKIMWLLRQIMSNTLSSAMGEGGECLQLRFQKESVGKRDQNEGKSWWEKHPSPAEFSPLVPVSEPGQKQRCQRVLKKQLWETLKLTNKNVKQPLNWKYPEKLCKVHYQQNYIIFVSRENRLRKVWCLTYDMRNKQKHVYPGNQSHGLWKQQPFWVSSAHKALGFSS